MFINKFIITFRPKYYLGKISSGNYISDMESIVKLYKGPLEANKSYTWIQRNFQPYTNNVNYKENKND
jgi:hypothetical protein